MIEGKKLRVSILIIAKAYTKTDVAYQRARSLVASGVDFEILMAEGDNPSMQRNELAKVASGEFLLFLDNDSLADDHLLSEYSMLIKKYPDASVFGGPSLLQVNQTNFHAILKCFFSSYLGIGPIRSRYNALGKVRITDEKELILSNMLIKREYFISLGGFNKNIYPGEENEFMKRSKPREIIYSPEAKVYRFPRDTLKEFLFQMYSYGQGRAKHLDFNFSDSLFLLPAIFSFYILTIFLSLIMHPVEKLKLYFIPLWIYMLIIAISLLWEENLKKIVCFFEAPFYFGAGHFAYGLGILKGSYKYKLLKIFFKKKRKLTHLKIVRIKDF